MTWIGPAAQSFIAVGGGAKVIIASFDGSANNVRKPTIVRSRGQLAVKPTSFAADNNIVGAFGICIVSDRAFAAGAALIPGPFTDAGWDGWFVWRSFSLAVEFLDSTGVVFNGALVMEIDSKAMRKVTDDETIVLMAESLDNNMQVSAPIRMLLKLS